MAFSHLLPNFNRNNPLYNTPIGTTAPSTTPTPTPLPGGTVSASSRGTGYGHIGPVGGPYPAAPGLVYSLASGGYITQEQSSNANSIQHKFGVSDPSANAAAASYYGYLGSLPTRNYGSRALERLYQTTGTQPALGPPMNQRLGQLWQGPFLIPGQRRWWDPTGY